KRKLREFSKGMTQRMGLAQALIHEPELIILDEPTDGVDPVGRAAVRQIVQSLKERGVTVFINSHLLQEVELICDRVVVMVKGKLVREGAIEELTPRNGRYRFELASVPPNLRVLLGDLGAGFEAHEDDHHGLDHGVWVPLRRMYPASDIPVVALSVNPSQSAGWHYRLGQALAPLRDEGILVVGSGGFSHNLRALD
ncbi:MAG: ATP-binding cassette domain-containing protein, partial [Phycisphaerae bacterium]|nr:ATP-binding cassette domain-containing protein [Phycisphaerae bacterium]